MSKRAFIAATMQNDGKTTVSLGLIYRLKKMFKEIGFIKPVGQRYLLEQGEMVDEDSVLIEHVYHLKIPLKDMSPVAVERGFTQKYIRKSDKEHLVKQIKRSFDVVAKNSELVIIEGTGHAGVGSVFDLSNAAVARLLEAKVILVSSGGIGRPIDEIMLNKALFDKEGVPIMGVIINKVLPEKYEKVNELVRLGLKRKGVEVLGVIPYEPVLSTPTMAQVREELGCNVLNAEASLNSTIVEKTIVAAMEPHDALGYMCDKTLIITPGDREDIILTALSMHLIYGDCSPSIAGIVLTGGIIPHISVLNLIKNTDIPVLLAQGDTYTVTSRIYDLKIKIRPEDKLKTNLVIDLIDKYVDIDLIVNKL